MAGSVSVLFVLAHIASGNVIVTNQEADIFFGNKSARVIYLSTQSKGELHCIDFQKTPLEPFVVAQSADGNPQISPDGSRAAYHLSEKNQPDRSYVASIDNPGTPPILVAEGYINPHWWTHPTSKKEYLLVQKGVIPGEGNGIFTVELDGQSNPVGSPVLFLSDPMANAGRSADGKFLANQDEEHERCFRGHGMYEISPIDAIANAEIKYWVYASGPGWYKGGEPYAGYCNGAMCPSGPSESFYGAMVHMGSGHTEIYIRQPRGYESMPLVVNEDAPETCPDKTIQYAKKPEVTLPDPKSLGIDGTDDHWGYSDWSTHNDFIVATGGTSGSSKGNKNGYFIDLTRDAADPNYVLKFASGGIAQPDLWVSEEGVSVSIQEPSYGKIFGIEDDITIKANARSLEGSITRVEFFAGTEKIGEAAGSPYSIVWQNASEGIHVIKVRATDSQGQSSESTPVEIEVRGTPTLAQLTISPFGTAVPVGQTMSFNATGYDQYGEPLESPVSVSWQVTGGGTIDGDGNFSAGTTPGAYKVYAGANSGGRTLSAQADVYVSTSTMKVNFQQSDSPLSEGYLVDKGLAYGERGDNHFYGWDADNTEAARERTPVGDVRYSSLSQMQLTENPRTWEIAVPNGVYVVYLAAGDPGYYHEMHVLAEGEEILGGITTDESRWIEVCKPVTVSDGRLTLTPGNPGYAKLCFIHIDAIGTNGQPSEDPIVVLSNFSGNSYPIGTTLTFDWTVDQERISKGLVLEITLDAGVNFTSIIDAEALPVTTTTYEWTIPESIMNTTCVTDAAGFRVCEYDGECYTMNGLFKILPAGSAVGIRSTVSGYVPGIQLVRNVVMITSPADVEANVTMIDAGGRVVANYNIAAGRTVEIGLKGTLPPGMYWVEMIADGKRIGLEKLLHF